MISISSHFFYQQNKEAPLQFYFLDEIKILVSSLKFEWIYFIQPDKESGYLLSAIS
jgi:hypothetical protein